MPFQHRGCVVRRDDRDVVFRYVQLYRQWLDTVFSSTIFMSLQTEQFHN